MDKSRWPLDPDTITYLTHLIALFAVLGVVLRRIGKWIREWFDASVRASFKRQWRQREQELMSQKELVNQKHGERSAPKPDADFMDQLLDIEEKIDDDETGTD